MNLNGRREFALHQPLLGAPHVFDRSAHHPLNRRFSMIERPFQRPHFAN